MLNYMLEDMALDEEFKGYGINDDERKFIKDMILGGPKDVRFSSINIV